MKNRIGIYDEFDFPPNYDAAQHDWAFIKGVAVAVGCMFALLIAYLVMQ